MKVYEILKLNQHNQQLNKYWLTLIANSLLIQVKNSDIFHIKVWFIIIELFLVLQISQGKQSYDCVKAIWNKYTDICFSLYLCC